MCGWGRHVQRIAPRFDWADTTRGRPLWERSCCHFAALSAAYWHHPCRYWHWYSHTDGARSGAVAATRSCVVSVAGSTDCVCYATVGVIDPVTSALHIIIGEERLLIIVFEYTNNIIKSELHSLASTTILTSHNALQETLSLWMCVQSTKPLLWCTTLCLCWAMASTVMCWLKARNTAGWDLYDMTTLVWVIQRTGMSTCWVTLEAVRLSVFIFSLKLNSTWNHRCDWDERTCGSWVSFMERNPTKFPRYVLFKNVVCTSSAVRLQQSDGSSLSRHRGVPEQQKLCRHSSLSTSGPAGLQPER